MEITKENVNEKATPKAAPYKGLAVTLVLLASVVAAVTIGLQLFHGILNFV